MVVGLPAHLQSDRALATFYESLGVGTVESAHVCRHVTTLQRLIEQRAHALRHLEMTYTRYYGNPSGRTDYDPDAILAENDITADDNQVENGQGTNRDSMVDVDEGYSLVRASSIKKRPTMRLGFMGILGRKVDKIDHYREVFATLDKAVQKMRMSRVYATTSIGFVTFEEMHAAVSFTDRPKIKMINRLKTLIKKMRHQILTTSFPSYDTTANSGADGQYAGDTLMRDVHGTRAS